VILVRRETGVPASESQLLAAQPATEAVFRHRILSETLVAYFMVGGTAVGAAVAFGYAAMIAGPERHHLALGAASFVLTGLGVTLGLHRHLTHRSFAASRWLQLTLTVLGVASGQGYLVRWVFDHRMHHRLEDQPGDPHSPYWWGREPLSGWRGFLHAHFLWLLRERPLPTDAVVGDLARDRALMAIDRASPLIALAGILLPGVLSVAIWKPGWESFLLGCLWGGVVRMFLLAHVTWTVNSVCHIVGSTPPGYTGRARNNVVIGILAVGEGWHANHHERPRRARHGVEWWQFDLSYLVLKALAFTGAVWDLKET
jgi:stearoyl-CoA desaturase (delta-9 desaturase)